LKTKMPILHDCKHVKMSVKGYQYDTVILWMCPAYWNFSSTMSHWSSGTLNPGSGHPKQGTTTLPGQRNGKWASIPCIWPLRFSRVSARHTHWTQRNWGYGFFQRVCDSVSKAITGM
jgi:hypothetical protein